MKIKQKSKSNKAQATSASSERMDEREEITLLQQRLRDETPESGTQLAR